MPPILRINHERFAQKIAEGYEHKAAYVEVYGNASAARQSADRLLHNPRVRARIDELLERRIYEENEASKIAIKERAISKEYILNSLLDIADRCMQQTVAIDPKTKKPIEVDTPNGKIALLAPFAPREATRALELLGKERGMFIDRRATMEVDDLENLTREQLIEELRKLEADSPIDLSVGAEADKPARRGGKPKLVA